MKKSYKKKLISILVFFISILLSISYIIVNNTEPTNTEENKEKIYYQIKYLANELISISNLINNNTNWSSLQKNLERLYNYWNSVILDLNSLNIEKKYLTDFGKKLDNLTISIKIQDRQESLNNLIELYKNIIYYAEKLNYNEIYVKIIYAQYNLLMAYSNVETGNWTLTHEYVLIASENMLNVVNSMEIDMYSQYNVNQAYIALRELENLINIKDLDLFYLKYSIAIEKIKNLSV